MTAIRRCTVRKARKRESEILLVGFDDPCLNGWAFAKGCDLSHSNFRLIGVLLALNVVTATLVAFSSDFHELLHHGEQNCWHTEHAESSCRHPSDHGDSEHHRHGLITLIAEGLVDEPDTFESTPERPPTHSESVESVLDVLLVARPFPPTAPRPPPVPLGA